MTEFEQAALGDKRRTRRLCQIAESMAAHPGASIPQASPDWAASAATYRFLQNPAVSPAALLAPHQHQTLQRAARQPRVLAISDTTTLNYSGRERTAGLGPINNSPQSRGLLLHSTLAFSPQREALGLVDAAVWARAQGRYGQNHRRDQRPLADKESHKWLASLQSLQAQAAALGGATRWVWIADREADLYELFAAALSEPNGPAVLVRLAHDRVVAGTGQRVSRVLARTAVAARLELRVPRQGTRRERVAVLAVRHAAVRIASPWGKTEQAALALWVVEAREVHAPRGATPLLWRLWSTTPVADATAALEQIQWYSVRWQVELYHRVLKSGCRVEERQLQSAENVERMLVIDQVVAWQVMQLSGDGRQHGEQPVGRWLAPPQWQALYAAVHRGSRPPAEEPRLAEAVRWIGRLGGHLGRKGDGPPGATTLWRGLQRLQDITLGWSASQETQKCV